MTSLESTDIFKCAYYLCMGADLTGIRFKNRQIASFLITGCGLDRFDRDYVSGRALVNPVQLRTSLNWLRDELFEKMRQRERRYDNERQRRYPFKRK